MARIINARSAEAKSDNAQQSSDPMKAAVTRATNRDAYQRFLALEARYRQATGQMAEPVSIYVS